MLCFTHGSCLRARSGPLRRRQLVGALATVGLLWLPAAGQAAGSKDIVLSVSATAGGSGLADPPAGAVGMPLAVSVSVGAPGGMASFAGAANDVPLSISAIASADASDPGTFYATAQGSMLAGTSYGPTWHMGYAADCRSHCGAPAIPPPGLVPVSASFELTGSTTITGSSYADVTAIAQLGSKFGGAELHFSTTTVPTLYHIATLSTSVPADGLGMPALTLGVLLELSVSASGGVAEADFAHTFRLTHLDLPEGYGLVTPDGRFFTPTELTGAVPEPSTWATLLLGLAFIAARGACARRVAKRPQPQ